MKEQKYRFIGVDDYFEKGEILTMIHDNGSKVCQYSNGRIVYYLKNYDHKLPDVELITESSSKDFTVGSKWVAKCDITTSDDLDHAELVLQGEICVLDRVRSGSIRFEGGFWLTREESSLLLEPYKELLIETTTEEVDVEEVE